MVAFATGSFGVWEDAPTSQVLQASRTPSGESNYMQAMGLAFRNRRQSARGAELAREAAKGVGAGRERPRLPQMGEDLFWIENQDGEVRHTHVFQGF